MFDWVGEDSLIQKLVYGLKGGGNYRALLSLLSHYYLSGPRPHLPDYVIYPKRKGDTDYHAMELAEALIEVFNFKQIRIVPLFLKTAEEQKKHSFFDRKGREFMALETNVVRGGSCLFVDDLLTTGSTALAAWRCLGKPVNFQCFTMAHRRLV